MSTAKRALARAVQFDRYGGPEVLEVRRGEIPVPGPREVLVRIHATGLNPKDAMIRSGALRLQSGRTFPRGTGFDLAGVVVDHGSNVGDLPAGTPVWGFLDGVTGGAAADYVIARRDWLARKPEGLSWTEAAALPLAASAALQALRDVARLQPGERVLIRGASGGVGSAAIQIARAMGCHVTALTSAHGIQHCIDLGADHVVDLAHVRPMLAPRRYHVYLDCVGRSPLRRFGSLLTSNGRWVAVAPSLPIFVLSPLSRPLSRILPLPRLGFVVVRPVAADLEELARVVVRGELRMPVRRFYTLDEIASAHADMGTPGARGKTVITVSPEAAAEARFTAAAPSAVPVA